MQNSTSSEKRYLAVKIGDAVYVATRPSHETEKRMPVRHVDVLTKAIRAVAGSKIDGAKAQKLIKKIDMGQVALDFGTALEDGTNFISDM